MSKTTWTTERTDELRTLKSQGQTNWQIAERFSVTADAVKAKWADMLRQDEARLADGLLREKDKELTAMRNELEHSRMAVKRLATKAESLQLRLEAATSTIQAYPQRPLWRRIWGAIVGKWPAS